MLQNIIFPLNQIFKYNMTGKFKALFPEWKHNHAPLIDYELIIVTEGELFLSYQGHNFHIAKSGYPKISLDTMYTRRFNSIPIIHILYLLYFAIIYKK